MARLTSPAPPSASASAVFKSPSKISTFCSQEFKTPLRMSSRPARGAALSLRPTLKEYAKRAIHGELVLARELGELDHVRRGAHRAAAYHFKNGRAHFYEGVGANMGETHGPLLSALKKKSRAIELAERP